MTKLIVQLLFIGGVTLVIGIRSTVSFFFQRKKWKGTLFFVIGFVIVLLGWPFIGMLVEAFGFINLFGFVISPLSKVD